jgi:NADH-quinone oxidoreductase subunit B
VAVKRANPDGLGAGASDATQIGSDVPSQPPVPATRPGDDLISPIVVPNTLWKSIDPAAYDGDRPTDITHLAELEASADARRDNARWSGPLEVIPTKADYVLDLIRMNSLWPLLSGLACCAIEMMSAATSKNDMDRWGMFPFRASPRQADVLIVAGTLTTKMAGPLVRLWEQMPEPKWCVAMGDCTCSGGRYKRSYSTVEGIDRVMPVDVYVPGCPPRPEGLIFGMMKLQQLVKDRRGHWPERPIGPTVPAEV